MKKFILILFFLFLSNNIFAEVKVPGSGEIHYWGDFEEWYKKQLKKSQKKKQKLNVQLMKKLWDAAKWTVLLISVFLLLLT